jgi:UDP:flavonoid glycosyltransferase YjiC (YdhE family)
MMRILFTACPMFGHVNTVLPLALATRRAGHTVVLATGADHVGRVAAMGLTTWAVGPTYAQAGWPPRSPLDFITTADKRCVDLLPLAEQWGPDVVVQDEIEAAGAIVAARTGARLVVHELGIAASGRGSFAPLLDDLGARWQVEGLSETVHRATHLSVCPPSLRPPDAAVPPDTRPLRPTLTPPGLGDRLPSTLAALPHDRTVHLTLGTVFAAPTVLADALSGLRRLPVNVVVTSGPGTDPADLGPQARHVLVAPYLPHALLLPRCALVVSQGGAGILFGALAHGLPQLVLPQGADQFANAAAVERTGAGIALEPGAVTVESVRDAAARLLADPGYAAHARTVQDEIAAMPDADAVVAQL